MVDGEWVEVKKPDPLHSVERLAALIPEGEYWHSGGGNLVLHFKSDEYECVFGFADDHLGWEVHSLDDFEYLGWGDAPESPCWTEETLVKKCREIAQAGDIQHPERD